MKAAAVLAFAVGISACGSSSSDGGGSEDTAGGPDLKDLSFAYASGGDAVGIFKTVGDGVVSNAEALGIEMKRYDNNLDGPTALSNAGLIAQTKPDVAIDWNTVVGVGEAVGQQFTRAEVPCIAVNQQIPGCSWFNLSNKQMGTDAAAVILPEAKKRGWDASNTTVVMVIAAANGTEVNDGPRYFYVDTADTLVGFEKVEPGDITASTTTIGGTNGVQIDCKSTIDGAFAAMQNAVGTIPKDNNILLYGTEDGCTIGAYNSLKKHGYGDRILTGGLGAGPEGLAALRSDPNWLVEGALFTQTWGAYVLAQAIAITDGVTPPELTSAPQIMLTKDTVDTYYDAEGEVISLPPLVENNEYLAKYNVLQKFFKVQGLNS
jgi:ribose transport system substrate-binding protein